MLCKEDIIARLSTKAYEAVLEEKEKSLAQIRIKNRKIRKNAAKGLSPAGNKLSDGQHAKFKKAEKIKRRLFKKEYKQGLRKAKITNMKRGN